MYQFNGIDKLTISDASKTLGLQLINHLNIPFGSGLGHYLGVNPCFNNHQAVMLWIEHLNLSKNDADILVEVTELFLKKFPETSYQFA